MKINERHLPYGTTLIGIADHINDQWARKRRNLPIASVDAYKDGAITFAVVVDSWGHTWTGTAVRHYRDGQNYVTGCNVAIYRALKKARKHYDRETIPEREKRVTEFLRMNEEELVD